MTTVSSVHFPEIKRFDTLSQVFTWQRQTSAEDGSWYNGPTENSMIISPYVGMKLNGAYSLSYA